jgi:hypothetical protein
VAQFYLLSVLTTITAGLTLAGDWFAEKVSFLASFKKLRENRTAQTVLAIITIVVGLVKLVVLSPGEHVPVVGDILPALAGVALGALMLIEVHRLRVEGRSEPLERLSKTVLTYRVPVGIAGAVIGFLHFLVPGAVIL